MIQAQAEVTKSSARRSRLPSVGADPQRERENQVTLSLTSVILDWEDPRGWRRTKFLHPTYVASFED
jgi:hypothetical protein